MGGQRWIRDRGSNGGMKTAGLWNDVRFAMRGLFRAPAFTVIMVGTLALGIGATTAIFSVVNGVLLKPLPFEDPDELIGVGNRSSGGVRRVWRVSTLSTAQYFTYRDDNRVFEASASGTTGRCRSRV